MSLLSVCGKGPAQFGSKAGYIANWMTDGLMARIAINKIVSEHSTTLNYVNLMIG
jgi:hypothetical protein